jgi:hypothetical protein
MLFKLWESHYVNLVPAVKMPIATFLTIKSTATVDTVFTAIRTKAVMNHPEHLVNQIHVDVTPTARSRPRTKLCANVSPALPEIQPVLADAIDQNVSQITNVLRARHVSPTDVRMSAWVPAVSMLIAKLKIIIRYVAARQTWRAIHCSDVQSLMNHRARNRILVSPAPAD